MSNKENELISESISKLSNSDKEEITNLVAKLSDNELNILVTYYTNVLIKTIYAESIKLDAIENKKFSDSEIYFILIGEQTNRYDEYIREMMKENTIIQFTKKGDF